MSLNGEPTLLPEVLWLYLQLAQYPILADAMRARMRHELFARGVILAEEFEREVVQKAILSQEREGLEDPYSQEPRHIWQKRLARIRDNLTDSYFALNLPHDLFAEIVQTVLARGASHREVMLSFNPELAPPEVLFAQAEQYESLPPDKRSLVEHHLQEIKVVLIRGMVSDRLPFLSRAKRIFTVSDLLEIKKRRIGGGKIGGKAAGMLLAWQSLQREDPDDAFDLRRHVDIPESFFLGSDVYYEFKAVNRLTHFMNQKYKPRSVIADEHPDILRAYRGARFPEYVLQGLREVLEEVGDHPLIVRSSSLLEDSFGTSFAGKYDSFYCPNQGSPEQNLVSLTDAVSRIYASVLCPDALLYRRQHGLTDYDERMAVLIQKVEGMPCGQYFFPTVAGVAFGRNPYRWTQRIRREDGFMRLVWGLGTRAVDRVPDDYPRMVALSHPELRPVKEAREIQKHSQRYVDVLDLQDNAFKTLPVTQLVSDDYPFQHELFSLDQGDWIQPILARPAALQPAKMVLTFDCLLSNTDFVPLMRALLKKLERQLEYVPDLEFTLELLPGSPKPHLIIHLLQCRPLSSHEWAKVPGVPRDLPGELLLFSSSTMVPQGYVSDVRYIVYVDPFKYSQIPDRTTKLELARIVGRLNKRLEGERFILMGPGRWGSTNLDLGVKVTYADIFNAKALIEIASEGTGGRPEASYGTHFFQDLVESQIYPLALDPEGLSRPFFEDSANALVELLPESSTYADYLKVIDVPSVSDGRLLEIIMDGERESAVGFLSPSSTDLERV